MGPVQGQNPRARGLSKKIFLRAFLEEMKKSGPSLRNSGCKRSGQQWQATVRAARGSSLRPAAGFFFIFFFFFSPFRLFFRSFPFFLFFSLFFRFFFLFSLPIFFFIPLFLSPASFINRKNAFPGAFRQPAAGA